MKKAMHPSSGRLLCVILIDLAALGICLCAFSYFHHVRVRDLTPTAIASAPQAAVAPAAQADIAASGTDQAVAETASLSEPAPSDAPAATPAEETADPGMFGAKFADKFATGDVEQTATSYKSKNVSVEITTHERDNTTYYVADCYVRDISCLRTAVALDYREFNEESRKNVMQVLQLSELAGGIAAISGDNFVYRNAGVLAIRNGLEWEKKLPCTDDICVLFYDGTMETFSSRAASAWRTYVDGLYERAPYQVWSFGPGLLDEAGNAKTSFNSSVTAENPRAAIGYFEPGHYCFVLADGRQAGYSVGLTLNALSEVFAELGCKVAYNFDGGDTVAMSFGGALVNHPENDSPRSVSDILLVGEPVDVTAASAAGEEG